MSREQAAALFHMALTNIYWQRGTDRMLDILHPDIIPWPQDIWERHDFDAYNERGSYE